MTKTCAECGHTFAKRQNESRAYWATKRFCSLRCKGKEHSRRLRRGVLTSSGATFRVSARNYLPKACEICGWDEASCDVAHIVPGIDSLDNVVMLCPNHHRVFDAGGITIDELHAVARRLSLKEEAA